MTGMEVVPVVVSWLLMMMLGVATSERLIAAEG
jgi:hypothetical protein